MTRVVADLPYAPQHGERGCGDLYLPDAPDGAPTALLLHGGGWDHMNKASIAPVARAMTEAGWAVFAANYRLLRQAPWPACGDDCLAAARFLLEVGHEALAGLDTARLLVAGASAGGHLALMTGLRLPRKQVRAVLSVAGPSDLLERQRRRGEQAFARFFGRPDYTEPDLRDASPVAHLSAASPPLLCIHSTADRLVPFAHSERLLAAARELGVPTLLHSFAGLDENHGIWVDGGGEEDLSERVLVAPVRDALRACLAACC